MVYGSRDDVVSKILDSHTDNANSLIKEAQSTLFQEAVQKAWNEIDFSGIVNKLNGKKISYNFYDIQEEILQWIKELELYKEGKENEIEKMDNPSADEKLENTRVVGDIKKIISVYEKLKEKAHEIMEEYEDAVRVYRSPLRQALNDITLLYNSVKDSKGDFSDFENVSVYMHGIESDGEGFLDSAVEAAEDGDIIVYHSRSGEKEYYIAYSDENGNVSVDIDDPLTFEELKTKEEYLSHKGRMHLVYDTEHENEHRQETSDDLAEELNEMGLLNDKTEIDLFGHSYGGRRSFQFAMDYPDSVRSITTIGTPYNTNTLGKGANPLGGKTRLINPDEYSGYQDFNTENQRTDDGVSHSNVYTDMKSETMSDAVDQIEETNPEVYQQLQEMDITAVAGDDKFDSDLVVSVKSQHGDKLGNIIDERLRYDVDTIGHLNEVNNEEYIDLISEVNKTE